MKRKLLPVVTFLLCVISFNQLRGQQDPQFTQFFYNKLIMNPAYAGAKDAICATALFRSQWAGLKGAPISALFSADASFNLTRDNINKLGVGLTSYYDQLGFERNFAFRVAGAYRRDLGFAKISAGVDLGFSNKGLSSTAWVYPDPVNGSNDPAIPQNAGVSNFGFDLGVGIYMNADNWYAGVSALHLTASDFKDVNIRQARHMYFMGGYTFRGIANSDFDINPNILVKTEFATAQLDVNVNVIWRQYYWAGLTYRIQDALAVNLGLNFGAISPKLQGLQLGYAIDIPTSRLATYGSGGHEILLRYCFKLAKAPILPIYDVRHLDSMKDHEFKY